MVASTWKMPYRDGSAMTAMPSSSPPRISRDSRLPTSPSLTRYSSTAYPSSARCHGLRAELRDGLRAHEPRKKLPQEGARIPRRRRGQPGTCSKYLDSDPARLPLNEHFAS